MTCEEKKQYASDILGDMSLALERKRRIYNNCVKRGAVDAAADLAAEIVGMEAELQCAHEVFDLTFNEREGL